MELKRHIFVCYSLGYGGDFMSNVIEVALGISKEFVDHPVNRNRYYHLNKHFSHYFKNVNTVLKMHQSEKRREYIKKYSDIVSKNHPELKKYNEDHFKFFDIYNEEDTELFIQNIIELLDSVDGKAEYVVTNLHYYTPVEQFSIYRAKKALPFFLTSSREKHHLLFNFIGNYKTEWNLIKRVDVQEIIDSYLKPQVLPVFDNMIPIDVGRLFFSDDYVEEFEKTLSDSIGMNLSVDKLKIVEYKNKNDMILKDFLGEDYGSIGITELVDRMYRVYMDKR